MSSKTKTPTREEKSASSIDGSTTEKIQRRQITLNPYNPKRHTDQQVKTQAKNIKRVGYLGGIIWNKTSGNLVDGHRRVQALDIIHKYDGTPATDYTLKVEVVEFDEKTEKEQMTYQAVGNSKADFNLIATYAPEIDLTQIGLSAEEMEALTSLYQSEDYAAIQLQTIEASAQAAQAVVSMSDIGEDFITPRHALDATEQSFDQIAQYRSEQPHETAEAIKAKKQHNTEISNNRNAGNMTYIMLSFKDEQEMQDFCDITGVVMTVNMIMSGMDFLERLKVL